MDRNGSNSWIMPLKIWILKNMNRKFWILLPLFFLIGFSGFGQDKKNKADSEAADSAIVLGKGRLVLKDRIYRQNASYITFGYGAGHSFQNGGLDQNMAISYQHFIKKLGLQIGYHSSSDNRTWWNSDQKLNDLFLGAGKRWEGNRFNFAVFGGPTWAYGRYTWWDEVNQKSWVHFFSTPGLRTEVLFTYKVAYDIGIGLSAYGSLNKEYSVAGAEIHLFFSTAFVRNYN
jgi:hypothetical protein